MVQETEDENDDPPGLRIGSAIGGEKDRRDGARQC